MNHLRLSLLVLLAACGLTVGSRYARSVTVDHTVANLVSVTASDSTELAGTSASIPAGALAANTTITVEPGLGSLVSSGEELSPAVIWGPSGLLFSTPITMTLPVRVSTSDLASDLEVVAEAGGRIYTISGLSFDPTRAFVVFKVSGFGSYQVRRHHRGCSTSASCPANQACVNGECSALASDGGISNGCARDADCGSSQQCINGACALRCTPSDEVCDGLDNNCNGIIDEGCESNPVDGGLVCSTNADCGTAGQCQGGVCVTTNPTTCHSNADCGWGEYCENLGRTAPVCKPFPASADAGIPMDGGVPLVCRSNAECPASEVCTNGYCALLCIPSQELCDGLDNDCDGIIDNGCAYDGGVYDGGIYDGGSYDGGVYDGGSYDGGSYDGGVYDGGSYDGGVYDGGVYDGGVYGSDGGVVLGDGGGFCNFNSDCGTNGVCLNHSCQ